ncbi:MAG: 16S rRNA (uracil(1498)-N(3))-methyltransferase [Acidobacteria bacterium]|nr:16S rRNA (uracil(1498)-N(3))-methyltransferase [Acidobacteriota bacterium]
MYLNPALESADAVIGARVSVTGEEARHGVSVARVRIGERIAIGDGAGFLAWGAVVTATPNELAIEVDEVRHDPEPEPPLWLAQALAKGDRDELAVQAATELGAAGVIPWAAERSVSRWEGLKETKGRERWVSIVREASKQAIRSRVPEVAALATAAALAALPGRLLILDPVADVAMSEVPLGPERITLVVGPEGGISAREFALLAESGATRVRLGREVLRTSTAGPAALALVNVRLGRW